MEAVGSTSAVGVPGGAGPPGSLPPVRLPVVADSLATQTQPPAEDDEDSLFGSDDDAADAVPPAPAAASVAATAAAEAELFGDDDDGLDERALFGDDADAPDLDERALFGSEEEGEVDDRALFGTDDEQETAPQPVPPRSPAHSELSEMDEREIFGEVSDDEPEKVEEVQLRIRPAPGDDRTFCSLRLPNVLSIERTPFHADNIPQSILEGYKEFKNTQNKSATRLLNPENCVRWRFKKGPNGEQLEGEEGRPQYESNARIVEWEDGSRTLFVGSETFEMTDVDDHVLIFEENSQSVQVCHGTLRKRITVTPKDLKSQSHEMLKRSQYSKFEANRRSLLMTQEEAGANQQVLQLQSDERERQRREERLAKRALEQGTGVMTRGFLEDDDARSVVGSEAGREIKRAKTA